MRYKEMSLRFVLKKGGPAIVLSQTAIDMMSRYRQTSFQHKEAGGQLFAQFIGTDTVIVEATPPSSLDRRARSRFWPNRYLQQKEINSRHKKGFHFVGDWHSHPESVPNPSGEDIQSMMNCFNASLHELQSFILIVIGLEPSANGLFVALVKGKTVDRLMLDR